MKPQQTLKTGSARFAVITFVVFVLALSIVVRSTFRHRRQQRLAEFLAECSSGSSNALTMIEREPWLLNTSDDNGWNCLINASKFNRLELVQELLIQGASTGTRSMKHSALRGASLFGFNDVVTALLEAGAYVDVYSAHQRTALMGAAMNGHKHVVETLLRAGADKVLKNDDGMTALDLAKQNDHIDIASLLAATQQLMMNDTGV